MRSVKKQQEWAKGQIKNPSQSWDGMCQSFARQSYGMGGFVMWYAWERPDLKGAWIGDGTYAWTAIKKRWS